MIPDDFKVEPIEWSNEVDRAACQSVREAVFVVEQRVPREDEWDAQDARSQHVLARDLADNPIGTGRLVPPGAQDDGAASIGRVAVLQAWRGRGVGEALMHLLIERARASRYRAIEMHAQSQAVSFYKNLGFRIYGEEFLECEIAHFHMRMDLPLPESTRPPPSPLPSRPETFLVDVESHEQAQAQTLLLIEATRRELCIYTRDLDPGLLDTESVMDALRKLAIAQRDVSIRIIVQDAQAPVRRGHRLIALAQRLPSIFTFRTPVTDPDRQYASAFVVNDARGYYFRVLGNRYEGDAVNYDPGRHAQLQDYFNQVWERSEPSEELRVQTL